MKKVITLFLIILLSSCVKTISKTETEGRGRHKTTTTVVTRKHIL